MSIEDNLEIFEDLFHRAVKVKHYDSADFYYNIYNDYHQQYQEYIWYYNLETGLEYIREVYNDYNRNRRHA